MNGTSSSRYREDRVVEKAVDTCFEVSKYQVNPYKYLYHNPNTIRTLQYFAHWAQAWTKRSAYIVLLQAANVGGYEVVPAALTYRNAKRDGISKRGVRVGRLRFFLLKKEEMAPGLLRRYEKYRKRLAEDLRKFSKGKDAYKLAEQKAKK